MESVLLIAISTSIFIAALLGKTSGLTTAILEICAGILIGNMLDLPWPAFLTILAELGIVTLMFLTGIEMDFRFLRQKGIDGMKVGVVAFFISFATILGTLLFFFQFEADAAYLFAIGLSECSAAIVFPVLRRKGALGDRRRIILATAMTMEIFGILLLTLRFAEISPLFIGLLVFIGITALGLHLGTPRFQSLVDWTHERVSLKFVLSILLIATFLAHNSGVDAVIVAFILGMFFNYFVGDTAPLQKQLEDISFGFLTPLFFISIGYSISFMSLIENSLAILGLAALNILVTSLGLYSLARKYYPKRARVASILLNAPLIVGSIAATIGKQHGILDDGQYTLLIGTAILCSIVAVVFGRYPEDDRKI